MVLSKCTSYHGAEGVEAQLDENKRNYFNKLIKSYAQRPLRNIALAYKMVDYKDNLDEYDESQEDDLTLLGIVGIEDAVRPDVPGIITTVQEKSKITVRMVTGDNLDTAISIAKQCNILKGDPKPGEVMEGPKFKEALGDFVTDDKGVKSIKNIEKMKEIRDKLKVLARSSPENKYMLVTGLMQLGHTVAVTGDGTNDAPALRQSDVGFAMNIAGTDVAKAASDIIMVNDNFTCIAEAVKWGRNIYDNIRKFVQF